jgi:hypothetical protein
MVFWIQKKNFGDPEQTLIKTLSNVTIYILSGCTKNLATICTILLHYLACKVNSNLPTPFPSLSSNKFPHPKGCASQLRPWLSGRKLTRPTFTIFYCVVCGVYDDVMWVWRYCGITRQPTRVIITYAYWFVAAEKENWSMMVLECPGWI